MDAQTRQQWFGVSLQTHAVLIALSMHNLAWHIIAQLHLSHHRTDPRH